MHSKAKKGVSVKEAPFLLGGGGSRVETSSQQLGFALYGLVRLKMLPGF
jgi:hypothetical protein